MRKKSESDPDEQKSGKTSKRTEIQQQQKDLRGYRSQEGNTKSSIDLPKKNFWKPDPEPEQEGQEKPQQSRNQQKTKKSAYGSGTHWSLKSDNLEIHPLKAKSAAEAEWIPKAVNILIHRDRKKVESVYKKPES